MTRIIHLIITLFMIAGCALSAYPQRRVTPVDPTVKKNIIRQQPGKPKPLDRTHIVEQLDANGNTILVDTLTGLEVIDSLAIADKPRNLYPKYTSVSIGLNVWDPIMRCLGQKYGIGDVWARFSFYNRFMPFAALGLGNANITPDGLNYTWKSKIAPYLKLGFDYNVFYNNSPDYQLLVGLRYGITRFSFQVVDVTVPGGYWKDPATMNIPSQTSTIGYLEISLGLRVKLIGNLAAGWAVTFRSLLNQSKCPYGEPMYIPGFGKRGQPLGASISFIYTIPLNYSPSSKVHKSEQTSRQPSEENL